jgi:predicted GNAT superfamily acetyltransferase
MVMPIEVAAATPADRDWLVAQDNHIPAEWVSRCIASGEYLVARLESERAGFLRFSWFWRAIPYMELIRVADAQQRRGIGTALLKSWEASMRAQGAMLLMTSSMSDEPEPQAWHRRNGFVETGNLTFGDLQKTPEVFFVKQL